jgi:hypothetical protein
MGGYADDLFNIFYRMEPSAMVREGFAYGGQGRRDFQEQYGVLETIEKVEETVQRLFAGNKENRPRVPQAWSLAALVRQVLDEHDGSPGA